MKKNIFSVLALSVILTACAESGVSSDMYISEETSVEADVTKAEVTTTAEYETVTEEETTSKPISEYNFVQRDWDLIVGVPSVDPLVAPWTEEKVTEAWILSGFNKKQFFDYEAKDNVDYGYDDRTFCDIDGDGSPELVCL